MAKLHALLSPSSAHRWSSCTASVGASAANTEPDEGSDAARLGTCGHQILEDLLNDPSIDPQSFLGREFVFWAHRETGRRGDGWADVLFADGGDNGLESLHTVPVEQDLIDAVVAARDYVVEQAALVGGKIIAEQRVPICHITGEEGAEGTSDVVILAGDTVIVMDLKLGRRRVDAYDVLTPASEDIITGEHIPEVIRPNLQLSMYALGVIKKLEKTHSFEHVRLAILQPFLKHVSEWSWRVEELQEVGEWLSVKAEETRTAPVFVPSEDNCLYCRASGNCEAQTAAVAKVALKGFEDVAQAAPKMPSALTLGDCYAMVPLVNVWAKAVEERVRDTLHSGLPVMRSDGQGYKLVEGKIGARAWADEQAAEDALNSMRIPKDHMYKRKLISPSQAEALVKVKKPKKGGDEASPVIGKTQWARLQSLITQERSGPAVALLSDPRPAIEKAAGFEEVHDFDNADLF